MAEVVAPADPKFAGRLVTDVERIMAQPHGEADGMILADAAAAIASIDMHRARKLAVQAERFTRDRPSHSGEHRGLTLAKVAKALAGIQPDRARKLAAEAERHMTYGERGSRSWTARNRLEMARDLRRLDIEQAQRLVVEASGNLLGFNIYDERNLPHAVWLAGTVDPWCAARIADACPDGGWKAQALAEAALAVAGVDKERARLIIAEAVDQAQSVTAEEEYESASFHIARATAAIDPDRAEAVASSLGEQYRSAVMLFAAAQRLTELHS
nr:hypothetical protein GCM10025732_29710 [Glycomyces mayteni]